MTAKYISIKDPDVSGPWLVMVHSMSQDHRVFGRQVEFFRQRHPICLIDLPGHGLSADVPGPFGHGEMAAHVYDAIDAAGIEQCIYWGTHTGTALGLLLARRDPRRFLAFILEGVVLPGHVMPGVNEELQRACEMARRSGLAAATRQWFAQAAWFDVMRANPGPCRANDHQAIIDGFAGAPWLHDGPPGRVIEPIDDAISALDQPVLFYNGEHDLAEFSAAADFLGDFLPSAQRAIIPGAGGFPAWEYPEEVNHLVVESIEQFRSNVSSPTTLG